MTIEFFEKMCDIDSDKTYVSKAKLIYVVIIRKHIVYSLINSCT